MCSKHAIFPAMFDMNARHTRWLSAGKSVQKTTFEAAEMILGPWNQQCVLKTRNFPCDV